jgi:FtsP/CotA-like multicopper oxidase with cupredoxin domain
MQVRMSVLANTVGKWVSSTWSRKTILWDYASFGRTGAAVPVPDATIEMVFTKDNAAVNGFNRWLINGTAFSMERMQPVFTVQRGKRYRVKMRNASDDIHPMHLHRHTFELTKIAGRSTSGVLKDVVMLGGYQDWNWISPRTTPGSRYLIATCSSTWITDSWR